MVINKTNGILTKIFIVVFLFIIVFNPCLFRIRIQYIAIGIELVYIVLSLIRYREFPFNRDILHIGYAFIPFLLFYTFVTLYYSVAGDEELAVYTAEYMQTLKMVIFVFCTVLFLKLVVKSNRVTIDFLFRAIIIIGIIQLLFVILAFLLPQVKALFNDLTIKNSFSDQIVEYMKKPWNMTYRGYGLAENLFDGFGYITSIIITLAFLSGISKKNKKLILLSIIMILMPLINARSGLVFCLIGFFIIILFYLSTKRFVFYLSAFIILSVLFLVLFNRLPAGLQMSLSSGIQDTKNLLSGEGVTGVYSEILGRDMVFPQNLLIGAGASPERLSLFTGIDSGYVQCIWRFGIIGTVLMLSAFAYCFVLAYRRSVYKERKVMIIVFSVVFFLYLFKLFSLSTHSNIFLFFYFIVLIILESSKNKKEICCSPFSITDD